MDKILGCNIKDLYPDALHHCFFKLPFSNADMFKCFFPNITQKPNTPICLQKTSPVCNDTKLDVRLIKGCQVKAAAARKCFNHQNVTECGPELKPYISRLNQYPDISKVWPCIQNIESACRCQRLVATKVIRMTMQSVEAAIRKIPDIYIIYYVRDPRGIYVSRDGFPFDTLCQQMERNHEIYLELNEKYPGVFHLMRYEDLSMNTERVVDDMFRFLNESVPPETRAQIREQTHQNAVTKDKLAFYRENSTQTATAWRNKLSKAENKTAIIKCGRLLNLLNYTP